MSLSWLASQSYSTSFIHVWDPLLTLLFPYLFFLLLYICTLHLYICEKLYNFTFVGCAIHVTDWSTQKGAFLASKGMKRWRNVIPPHRSFWISSAPQLPARRLVLSDFSKGEKSERNSPRLFLVYIVRLRHLSTIIVVPPPAQKLKYCLHKLS